MKEWRFVRCGNFWIPTSAYSYATSIHSTANAYSLVTPTLSLSPPSILSSAKKMSSSLLSFASVIWPRIMPYAFKWYGVVSWTSLKFSPWWGLARPGNRCSVSYSTRPPCHASHCHWETSFLISSFPQVREVRGSRQVATNQSLMTRLYLQVEDQSWQLIAIRVGCLLSYLSATSFVSLAKPCPWSPSAVCKSTWGPYLNDVLHREGEGVAQMQT